MMMQFNNKLKFKLDIPFCAGLTLFSIGLGKKIFFADPIGHLSNKLFALAAHNILSTIDAWYAALAYSLQIYFDFSGYSDMAIGLSILFGIRLPINFNSPYKANSIIDFWHRWHMTLSRFLLEYLYIPLGGNRKGILRRYINLMITMILGGLWHGAGWTFLIWGGLHGSYLIVNHTWRYFNERYRIQLFPKMFNYLSILLTFMCVTLAWVFFRAPNMHVAWSLISSMLGIFQVPNVIPEILLRDKLLLFALLSVAWFFPNSLQLLAKDDLIISSFKDLKPRFLYWQPTFIHAVIGGLLFSLTILGVLAIGDGAQFLYFEF